MVFSGITTALVTPFLKGDLDKGSFIKLLQQQVQEGIRQFVLASTTGESPVLEDQEVQNLCQWFQEFVQETALPLKMILATGTFSTKQSVEKTRRAVDMGAQAVLVITPYYNKPSQTGMLRHFEKVAYATSLPVLLYNVPSRTACSLQAETVQTLAAIDNIVGIKEATGDMAFFKKIKQICPKDFCFLSGDDLTCVSFFHLGGHGAISAGANVLARELIYFFNNSADALKEFEKYKNFFKVLFMETNPVGVKQILAEQGLIDSPELRLPLVALKNERLSKAFQQLSRNL